MCVPVHSLMKNRTWKQQHRKALFAIFFLFLSFFFVCILICMKLQTVLFIHTIHFLCLAWGSRGRFHFLPIKLFVYIFINLFSVWVYFICRRWPVHCIKFNSVYPTIQQRTERIAISQWRPCNDPSLGRCTYLMPTHILQNILCAFGPCLYTYTHTHMHAHTLHRLAVPMTECLFWFAHNSSACKESISWKWYLRRLTGDVFIK